MAEKTKLFEYHEILKKAFAKVSKEIPFVVHDEDLRYDKLTDLIKSTKRKKVRVESIETLPSTITHFAENVSVKKNRFVFTDRTGLFKVHISPDKYVIVLKYQTFWQGRYIIRTMYCASVETISILIKMMADRETSQTRPKVGIYNIVFTPHGRLLYLPKKAKDLPSTVVIHAKKKTVVESVDSYFNRLHVFTRFGKTGSKRILLYGMEGTGKTSIAYEVAKSHSKDKCVVFSTDPSAIIAHTANCAKHNVPTIVIAEECDKWLGGIDHKDRPNSEIKAYLDGHLANKNKMGELFILITNYPKQIEGTILLRPGRIHDKIEIGPVSGDDVLQISKMYFIDESGSAICSDDDLKVLQQYSFSGAQIERISQMCLNYILGTDKKLDKSVIEYIVNEYQEELKNLKNFERKDNYGLVSRRGARGVGFCDSLDPSLHVPTVSHEEDTGF